MPLSKLDEIYTNYNKNITNEDAQRELLEIFLIYAMLVKKIDDLSNSNIKTDAEKPIIIKKQVIVNKINDSAFIKSINHIFENNPALLQEKSKTFSELIGRELTANNQYVPIEVNEINNALLIGTI
jgi:hypothetical protein